MPPTLPALTALRFFLALSVVLHHYGGPIAQSAAATGRWWLANAIHAGSATVSGFFVLSGFVLSHNYLQADGSLRGARQTFWAARFARVYPVYALSLALVIPAYLTTGQAASPQEALLAILLSAAGLQAWVPGLALSVNSAAWSLCAEGFFYACFPWLIVLFRRWKAEYVALGCLAAIWMGPAMGATVNLTGEAWTQLLRFNPVLHLPSFVLGIAVYQLWRRGPVSPWVASPGLLAVIAAYVYSAAIGDVALNNALLVAPFAAVIAGLAAVRSFPAQDLLTRLGEASYSLYILHLPAGTFAIPLAASVAAPGTWANLATIAATAIGVSIAAHSAIEEPYRRKLRKLAWPTRPAISSA